MKLFVVEVERLVSYRAKHVVYCKSEDDVYRLMDDWSSLDEFCEQSENDDFFHEAKNKILNVSSLTNDNMPEGWDEEAIPWMPSVYGGDYDSIKNLREMWNIHSEEPTQILVN